MRAAAQGSCAMAAGAAQAAGFRLLTRPVHVVRLPGERKAGAFPHQAASHYARLGITGIDLALDPQAGRGIMRNALHEVRVETALSSAAGAGFALTLGLAMTTAPHAQGERGIADARPTACSLPVFWVCDPFTAIEHGCFYGPGLAAFGLDAHDLVRIHPTNRSDALWAAGEVAAARGAARFCLFEFRGHPGELDLTITRRLMLRARASNVPVILLRQSGHEEASAASTRWHVLPATSTNPAARTTKNPAESSTRHGITQSPRNRFIGPPAFRVILEKCRNSGGHSVTNDPQVAQQPPSSPAGKSGHRHTPQAGNHWSEEGKREWKLEWNPHEQRLVETRSDEGSVTPAGNGSADPATGTHGAAPPLSFPASAEAGNRPHLASASWQRLADTEFDCHLPASSVTGKHPGMGEFERRRHRRKQALKRG